MSIFEIMDMQADIKWIQAELETVKDPSLIDMLKRLIQYGKSKKEVADEEITEAQKQELDRRIEKIDQGKAKFYTMDEVENRLSKYL